MCHTILHTFPFLAAKYFVCPSCIIPVALRFEHFANIALPENDQTLHFVIALDLIIRLMGSVQSGFF